MTIIERYRVEKNGLGWCVVCGNGTRILFRSVMEHTCQCIASELRTAFADGEFIAERQTAKLLEELQTRYDAAHSELVRMTEQLAACRSSATFSAIDSRELYDLDAAMGEKT